MPDRMRLGSMLLTIAVGGGCSFNGSGSSSTPGVDAGQEPDASLPTSPEVRFVSITATSTDLQPGQYGFQVTAILQNDLDLDIAEVATTLTFDDGTSDRASDFRWRDVDMREGVIDSQPTAISAGEQATFVFVVDTLPTAAPPGPININGFAAFDVAGSPMSATPLDPTLSLPFVSINAAIVVDTTADQDGVGNETSFREALALAIASPGLDRIVFDPVVFPAGQTTTVTLDENNNELPVLDGTGGAIVIDGSGAGFALALDSNWESPSARHGLRVAGGTVVIHDIAFNDMGYNYQDEDVSVDDCGLGVPLLGGAIYVTGGTLILEGNRFDDTNVSERNCYAASVRIVGGAGHQVRNNVWTEISMDALFIDAATVEISGNVMDASADQGKSDDCMLIESQGGQDLWVVGNLCVEHEFSSVFTLGSEGGTIYVVNNTFARGGAQSAVRRTGNVRLAVMRNNVYLANNPSAVFADNNGIGLDLAYEVLASNALCPTCGAAMIDLASMITTADIGVADQNGSSLADFTPQVGSMLLDSGLDWLDRNGRKSGRHNGAGADRGAVERP